jgi:hypothetical protein
MSVLLQLTTENSHNLCILPNSAQLYINIKLRSLIGYWTIQLESLDSSVITDEAPIAYNPDIFKQYSDLTKVYGHFSIQETDDSSVSLENKLNVCLKLYWDAPNG